MARDLNSDLDSIAEQLASLRSSLMKQASTSTDDAASYLAPHARRLAKQFQQEGSSLSRAVQRNPAAATGAVIGALALGTVLGLFLAGSSRQGD